MAKAKKKKKVGSAVVRKKRKVSARKSAPKKAGGKVSARKKKPVKTKSKAKPKVKSTAKKTAKASAVKKTAKKSGTSKHFSATNNNLLGAWISGLIIVALFVGLAIWWSAFAQKDQSGQGASKTATTSWLETEFDTIRDLATSDRIEHWSKVLAEMNWKGRGVPSFGSAPKIEDAAPLVPKAFNCTTFVETVAALARSESPSEFFDKLLEIRYRDGVATYENRNHFPSVDWVPNNVKIGVLEDVTNRVAKKSGLKAKVAQKKIQKYKWMKDQIAAGNAPRKIASAIAKKVNQSSIAKLPYITLEQLQKSLGNLPNGAVVNLVRRPDKTRPVVVSHQGFVIRKKGKVYLRHASVDGKIKDVLLTRYLKMKQSKRWPYVGVHVVNVRES